MTIHIKTALILLATLVIGVLLGMLILGALARSQFGEHPGFPLHQKECLSMAGETRGREECARRRGCASNAERRSRDDRFWFFPGRSKKGAGSCSTSRMWKTPFLICIAPET